MNLHQLEERFEMSQLRDFACSWVLFAMTKKAETKLKLTTLESCYIELIENPKVNKRYYTLDLIQKLEA